MARLAPVPSSSDAVARLDALVPAGYEHYFDGNPGRRYFTQRSFEFRGEPEVMPLVHAFLDTCAATRDDEYRYLFDLLGTELATNALKHTRSGLPGRTFTLKVRRSAGGLTLTCRDGGALDPGPGDAADDGGDPDAPNTPDGRDDPDIPDGSDEADRSDHPDDVGRRYLAAASFSERLTADSGRGLALVDSLATAWGDNGHPSLRQVWFHLAYDLTGSSWPAA